MSTAVLTPEATPPEKKVLKQTDEYVRLLQHALTRLQSTPPRLILSPATQPRRGAVAIIIHIIPPPGYSLPPQEQYECPTTLQDLFDQDWVNQPGCVAEVVYIQRETNPDASSYNPSSASVSGKHVAFPGGRREADDESERYTAMRTTWEELGIDLADKEWLTVGQMDDREITTSLGKRLLMIISPFVFIRTSPYPFHPTPPDVIDDPTAPPPIPPTIYSVPLSYLLSPSATWSNVTIDISSRLGPGRFLGGKKTTSKRRRAASDLNARERGTASPPPPEGSAEEAAMIASSGVGFWLWALRLSIGFCFRTLVGDMRFAALILQGRTIPYAPGTSSTRLHDADEGDLKLWGLTLGMTLDLLSGMQPHLYQAPNASAGAQTPKPFNAKGNKEAIYTADSELRSRGSLGRRSLETGWAPPSNDNDPLPSPPPTKELMRQLGELRDLEGANIWTPSMTCVFPRFSIPDVNFWIWVFGKRYRRVVRGWEYSIREGGAADRRVNWSGQALAAFYDAVRKALLLVIIARIVGILLAIGFSGWWFLKRW
ncbi:hypothetical protein FRC04_003432 [Tulasnella sp. 424]|nr:hypothetical protein FRC04_003432 [Tulasnella sp. 424]KAG8977241.1 hypothetical protein FRC05_002241 [Tulasnella sp. 425]